MRILQFVAGLDANSGGPSRSVPNQCVATVSSDVEVHLAFQDSGRLLAPEVNDLRNYGVTLHPLSRAELLTELPRLVRKCDIIHINGMWSPGCLWLSWLARRERRPFVVAPRGMLEPWALAYRARRKKLALRLGFRELLDSSKAIQATAESEAINLRKLGISAPIAIVPNSVAVPQYSTSNIGTTGEKRILFLSRIHPKKGVKELVYAIRAHKESLERGSWRVVIAGTDSDGHWMDVERLAKALGVRALIEYVGPVDGAQKWDLYRSATLFVLPTYSENFGLVIAEALACGVPCVTTHGTPWQELTTNECGWWHPVGQEHLDAALGVALSTPLKELRAMGERGIALVKQRYCVDARRMDFHDLYEWVAHGGPEPKFLLTPHAEF